MKNFAAIALALLLMVAVTEQQEEQTDVESSGFAYESCKKDINTIINTTSERKRSLVNKRRTIAFYRSVLKTHVKEEKDLDNEVKNLTMEIQEFQDICIGFVLQDCCQIMIASNFSSETGLYEIRDPCAGDREFIDKGKMHVHCDMETDGGGWIVIQQRITNGTVNFTRNWEDYENGFGDLDGEFWIGLRNMHELTNQQEMELHISVWNDSETSITWNYQTFRISGPENKYRLTVGGGTGDGFDAFEYHNGQYFSTYDRDNDPSHVHCAYNRQGGWWYNSCHYANLNGRHQRSGLPGVDKTKQLLTWYNGNVEVYTNSVMMIRSKTCSLG